MGSSALVGSSNFTQPGLTENVELNVQITGTPVAVLQRLRTDRSKWNEFRDWMIRRKPEYDQNLIQDVLERTIVLFADAPDVVFRLAKLVLEDREPQPRFAAQFAKALGRHKHEGEARVWGMELLPGALEAFPDDEELCLAAARLSCAENDLPEAIRRYGEVVAPLDPTDWFDYLRCASVLGDLASQRGALEALRARLEKCQTPADLAALREALGYAWIVALAIRADPAWWIRIQLLLHLAQDQDSDAVHLLELVSAETALSWKVPLEFASLLEEMSEAAALVSGVTLVADLANRFWAEMGIPARRQAVEQLRALENLVEDPGASAADELAQRIGREPQSERVAVGAYPFKGLVIALIGDADLFGSGSTTSFSLKALRRYGTSLHHSRSASPRLRSRKRWRVPTTRSN